MAESYQPRSRTLRPAYRSRNLAGDQVAGLGMRLAVQPRQDAQVICEVSQDHHVTTAASWLCTPK